MNTILKKSLIWISGILFLGIFLVGYVLFFVGIGPGPADYRYRILDSCYLGRNSVHVVYITCDGTEGYIKEKVIRLGWNQDALFALTHPVTKRKYPNQPQNTYSEPDETVTYWWIIDLRSKVLYGPLLSEEEFLKIRQSLNLPEINLMSVEEAKEKSTLVE